MTDTNEPTKAELISLLQRGLVSEFGEEFSKSKVDLSGADLRNANLRFVNLSGSNLRGAILRDAVLRDANLRNAYLRGANLIEADFRKANLRSAKLRNANLRDANLVRATLIDANLIDANLRRANLNRANLFRADVRNADLRDADLRTTNLRGTNLLGAKLAGAFFDKNTIWPEGFDFKTATRSNGLANDEFAPAKSSSPVTSPRTRKQTLDTTSQSHVRSELEPVARHLQNVYQDDPNLNEEDQAFLWAQIQTLSAQMGLEAGGNTQIIELTIAQIAERFSDPMQLGDAERLELMRLGANEDLAERVIELVNAMLPKFAKLGGEDAESDALVLEELAQDAAEILGELDSVERPVEEPEDPDKPKLGSDLATGVATGAGREIAKEGGRAIFGEVAKRGGWGKVTTSLINAMETLWEALTGLVS